MRYAAGHKAKSRDYILSVASRSFREQGSDASGIGTVMKKAGLTKGGFYRHFKSKDDLFVEAIARAFDQMGDGLTKVAAPVPEEKALQAIISYYLSPAHANAYGAGCVLSALAPEIARKPLKVRRRVEALLHGYRERLLPFIPGATRQEKLATFQLLFPSMAGVLMMARLVPDVAGRDKMLREARDFFIRRFAVQ